jgi:hypothetical protein
MPVPPFKPTPSDEVRRVVAASFPGSEHAEIFHALDTCQLGPVGDARRFDILVLANGDIKKFRRVVELAKLDYRDLLLAAHYPETPKKRREMAERYRRLGLPVPESLSREG